MPAPCSTTVLMRSTRVRTLLGVVEVVLDDLGGAFDDGEDIVEVVGDARGERAQGVHLLAVQQLAVGDLQFLGALGDFLLDFGVAAEQLAVAIKGQAGEEERDGQPGQAESGPAATPCTRAGRRRIQSGPGVGSMLQLRSMARTWRSCLPAGRSVKETVLSSWNGRPVAPARGDRSRAAVGAACSSICPVR